VIGTEQTGGSGSALLESALAVYQVTAELQQVASDGPCLAAGAVGYDQLPLEDAHVA
jgi:hypothetical protein